MSWYPKRPDDLESAKTRNYFLQDSILKILYVRGTTRGAEVSEILHLPYSLLDTELRHLREIGSIVPISGNGIGGYDGLDFTLTKTGREYASELYSRSSYIGAAPVDIADYRESVRQQKLPTRWIKRAHMENAFRDLVISPSLLDNLGPALNSGGPVFVYGKPGNGKTAIAERLTRIFHQGIFVPYSIQIDGQIIQFFDEKVHVRVPEHLIPADHPAKTEAKRLDSRWVFVYRPFIIVGGELSLEMLDLIFQNGQHCYEAPFQLKANCGVLLVDDFGRQIVKPRDFLNRWIYPLEKGVDFLTLITGKKVEVPFDQMLIFSPNLSPENLADEAFWRRIRYKIPIPDPSESEFQQIFEQVCRKEKLEFHKDAFESMLNRHFRQKRSIRAVHARDILGQVKDQIAYRGLPPSITPELLDEACSLYFGDSAGAANLWSA